MERGILMILLCSGIYNFTRTSAEFFLVNKYLDWTEAQTYCRQRYTDLATVSSGQENHDLVSLAENVEGCVWMGLRYNLNTFRWSLGGRSVDLKYRFWADYQPNNRYDSEHCAAVSIGDGGVADRPCMTNLFFVCFHEKGENQYVLVEQAMAWWDAQTHCRTHYDDLARVNNEDVYEIILSLMNTIESNLVWIGLYRDPWSVWSDNNYSEFSNWETQPFFYPTNDNCACVSASTGKWNETSCTTKKPFFCYRDGRKTVLKVKIQSDIDLTKEIQLQILDQLKNRLASMGAENITMHGKATKKMTPNEAVPKQECISDI